MMMEKVKEGWGGGGKGGNKREDDLKQKLQPKQETEDGLPHESMSLPEDLFYWKSCFEISQISAEKL